MKTIYLVRHCKASGQAPNAPLTEEGREDSIRLADFFKDKEIDFIISSPFVRTVDTIQPFAEATGMEIILDERLTERVLSSVNLDEWMSKLEETYEDLDLKFEGGESSNKAMRRGIGLLEELYERPESNMIVVTHGALLSLIIKHYVPSFGFEDWRSLTNPDMYQLDADQAQVVIERIWE
ncbi:histidine phosphatase family protein [Paenibacillus tarimensis]